MATSGYYPFGMALGSTFSASEPNRTMYNGKELQNHTLNGLELMPPHLRMLQIKHLMV
jgi:hypothetical protein